MNARAAMRLLRKSRHSFAILLAFAVLPAFCWTPDEPPKKTFFLPKSRTAAMYILNRLMNKELIEAPRSEFVYVVLLERKGLEKKYRVEALEGLAKIDNTDPLA